MELLATLSGASKPYLKISDVTQTLSIETSRTLEGVQVCVLRLWCGFSMWCFGFRVSGVKQCKVYESRFEGLALDYKPLCYPSLICLYHSTWG